MEERGEGVEMEDIGPAADSAVAARWPAATILAAALAVGISVGWGQSSERVWLWLGIAAAFLIGGALLRRSERACVACAACATVALGAAWVTIQQHYVNPDDLAAHLGEEPMLLRVRGVALGPPVLKDRSAGSMAIFDYRGPATYFPIEIHALIGRDGTELPMRGRLLVRVGETVEPFRAGDKVDAIGMAHRAMIPLNPGEFDYRQYARSLGQAGILVIEARESLRVQPVPRSSLWAALTNWRQWMQDRASGWLLSNLPATPRAERDALLSTMLLGTREPELDGVGEQFRRVGLAHILAISGFNLVVLAGLVLLVLRFFGGSRRWHGWLIVLIVLVYLMLIEVRVPVLRAGLMTMAASLGLATGRRLAAGGLVAISAIIVLLIWPDQLFTPGFQLSYGVVLGLIHLSDGVRRRWFGPVDQLAASSAQMLGQWLRTAVAAAVVAWLIATPIVMFHFGQVTPLAAPLSVIVAPIAALLLALGYTKMLVALVLPSASLLLGAPLAVSSDLLLSVIAAADSLPGVSIDTPFPSTWWAVAATAWVCWWAMRNPDRRARWVWIGLAGIVLWAIWPLLPLREQPSLRIDMLAVGDGSCYVLRSKGQTVVFDAGSATALDGGRKFIVPTMRRLGIRSIDALLISHADLDHYSAVLELADAFDIDVVCITPHAIELAQREPQGPVAFLLEGLGERGVPVVTIAKGEQRTFGQCSFSWLHPPADQTFERHNDSSMVIRINVMNEAGPRRSALLFGDIQKNAVAQLARDELRADIIELPHHGSFNDAAAEMVRAIGAQLVLQSTGPSRLRNDRWAEVLARSQRLITARDGASWIEIDDEGAITFGTFVNRPAGLTAAKSPPAAAEVGATMPR